jgi:Carboxypeptidase regulatory-like domain
MQAGTVNAFITSGVVEMSMVLRVIAVLALMGGMPGTRQFQMRSVAGVVTDQRGEPLAGAVVLLENTADLTIRSYITQEDGRYFFMHLQDDVDYTLRARYQSFLSKRKRLSKFSSKVSFEVNLLVKVNEHKTPTVVGEM